jgi:FkbM family methyltransferase
MQALRAGILLVLCWGLDPAVNAAFMTYTPSTLHSLQSDRPLALLSQPGFHHALGPSRPGFQQTAHTKRTACEVVRRGQGGEGGKGKKRKQGGQQRATGGDGVKRETYSERVERLGAHAQDVVWGLGRNFRWRKQSNDANAILEVFGCEGLKKKPVYLCESLPSFSPESHVILDIGGHIGAYGVFAIRNGAKKVVAYEPHPENAEIYRENTEGMPVQLLQAAVVADEEKDTSSNQQSQGEDRAHPASSLKAELVVGKDYQGVKNTWRHALAPYSHYKGEVNTVPVETVPFALALTDDITFVKIDCEGAELDILPRVKSWRNVQRLVFEYRFAPRARMGAPLLCSLPPRIIPSSSPHLHSDILSSCGGGCNKMQAAATIYTVPIPLSHLSPHTAICQAKPWPVPLLHCSP